MVSRDIKVDKAKTWNWEKGEEEAANADQIKENMPQVQEQVEDDVDVDNFDDVPTTGTRSVAEIYQRCAVALQEPTSYDEAAKERGWKVVMEEELKMIYKNGTWELVGRPKNQNVIGVKEGF